MSMETIFSGPNPLRNQEFEKFVRSQLPEDFEIQKGTFEITLPEGPGKFSNRLIKKVLKRLGFTEIPDRPRGKIKIVR